MLLELALCLLALPGAVTAAASASRSDVSSYEGETVASVRLGGEPARAARLQRYLELKPGDRFTSVVMRHIVELLYATGELEDVVVEVRRGEAGLEVELDPKPAPLLAKLRVEGDRVISAKELSRIARLRRGEPLWTGRLGEAAREAEAALERRGYLEARVSASVRRLAKGAEAVFSVQAGRLARVESTELRGVTGALAELLREVLAPAPGQPFRRARAEKARDSLRWRLVEQGHWRAKLELLETYEPSRAAVSLVFQVDPGPRMLLELRGALVPSGRRRDLEQRLREGALRSDVVEEAADRLEDDFRARGHRDALVSHHEEPRPGAVALVFEIEPGPEVRLASLRLAGDEVAGLEPRLTLRPGEPFRERDLLQQARTLQRFLEDQGYPDAKVEPDLPAEGTQIEVVLRVRAGPRVRVRSVSVDADVALPADTEVRELRLHAGEPYRLRDLALDRNSLATAYRNAGYLQAEIVHELRPSETEAEVDVVLRVAAGPRTLVDHLVIAGLDRTEEEVVRRELLLQEGAPLGLQKVLDSQRRLGSLAIFQHVSVSEIDPESQRARSLVVTAEEAPTLTLAYGIGYAERDLLRGSVELTRRNLFGMDRSLSSFARASFRGSRFFTTYREPYLLGLRQELFVTGYREEEDRESFDFVRFGGLLQTVRPLSSRWSLILRYTFQETDLFAIEVPLDEVDRQFRSSTISGPSASLVNDTRDDPLDPRRGRFLGADVQLSHGLLGGDSFLKGFLQAAAYERLTARLVLAVNGRVGLARTFGAGEPLRLPLADRFFAGGDYSLRGFRLDSAGPLAISGTGKLVPTGGNALVLGGAELRLDAGRYISLAAFSEAGNVYPLVSAVDLGDLRYSAGVGVRYKSALGPLRLDWGYKLNRRAGEQPYRFHFTVGHAF